MWSFVSGHRTRKANDRAIPLRLQISHFLLNLLLTCYELQWRRTALHKLEFTIYHFDCTGAKWIRHKMADWSCRVQNSKGLIIVMRTAMNNRFNANDTKERCYFKFTLRPDDEHEEFVCIVYEFLSCFCRVNHFFLTGSLVSRKLCYFILSHFLTLCVIMKRAKWAGHQLYVWIQNEATYLWEKWSKKVNLFFNYEGFFWIFIISSFENNTKINAYTPFVRPSSQDPRVSTWKQEKEEGKLKIV